MRWEDLAAKRQRRGSPRRRRRIGGGGGGGFPMGGGGLGIGTIVVLGLVGWALGIDPRLLIGGAEILTGGGQQQQSSQRRRAPSPARRPTRPAQFVAAVLGSTEDAVEGDLRARTARPIARRSS